MLGVTIGRVQDESPSSRPIYFNFKLIPLGVRWGGYLKKLASLLFLLIDNEGFKCWCFNLIKLPYFFNISKGTKALSKIDGGSMKKYGSMSCWSNKKLKYLS